MDSAMPPDLSREPHSKRPLASRIPEDDGNVVHFSSVDKKKSSQKIKGESGGGGGGGGETERAAEINKRKKKKR